MPEVWDRKIGFTLVLSLRSRQKVMRPPQGHLPTATAGSTTRRRAGGVALDAHYSTVHLRAAAVTVLTYCTCHVGCTLRVFADLYGNVRYNLVSCNCTPPSPPKPLLFSCFLRIMSRIIHCSVACQHQLTTHTRLFRRASWRPSAVARRASRYSPPCAYGSTPSGRPVTRTDSPGHVNDRPVVPKR